MSTLVSWIALLLESWKDFLLFHISPSWEVYGYVTWSLSTWPEEQSTAKRPSGIPVHKLGCHIMKKAVF